MDEAIITVPEFPVAASQSSTFTIPDLSASLFDNVTLNGGEVVSTVIENVPEDTFFSAGVNQGFGTWVIPVADLSGLEITPPEYWAGEMNLTLRAITFESSNFDETNVSDTFVLDIEPVADDFLVVARNVDFSATTGGAPSGPALADPSLRMLDGTGDDPGEIPPEYVRFVYESVPDGIRFIPGSGGRLIEDGSTVTFIGTPDQANDLSLVTGPDAEDDQTSILLTVTSFDGADSFTKIDPAFGVTDFFRVWVMSADTISDAVSTETSPGILQGGAGNDIIDSSGFTDGKALVGNDGNDVLIGGIGANNMTGGAGMDIFKWEAGHDDGLVDRITDFDVGTDILSVSELLDGTIEYNPQDFAIEDFLTLTDDGVDSTITVTGSGNDLVVLEGLTGSTIQDLFDMGSILL